ncbi:MAG: hypothetical protein ACOC0D_03340, partial [Spirochaeta sp.]
NSYMRIWVRRSDAAWRVAFSPHEYEDEVEVARSGRLGGLLGKAIGFVLPPDPAHEESTSEELAWQDFIPEVEGDSIGIFPVLPENSVVVRTEVPITLGAGCSLSLYAAIPLWLSVRVVNSREGAGRVKGGYMNMGAALLSVPVFTLSQTWFGGPMTGRLCYRSDKTLSYSPNIPIDPLAYALCPIKVRNSSRAAIKIGSIAVPTEQMKLFRTVGSEHDVVFWTNPVSAVYTAAEELHLGVIDKHPKIGETLEPWMPPRISPTDHLFKRGMIFLRDITNS